MNKYQEALNIIKKINLGDNPYMPFEEDNIENVLSEEINSLQELVDKETPRKVINEECCYNGIDTINYICCPECNEILFNSQDDERNVDEIIINYCPFCGQKLDWSNIDD